MSEEIDILKGWEKVKLDELIVRMTNGANSTQFDEKVGFPISRIETIWNQTIDLTRVKYIKENEPEFVEKYKLRDNDILFSHINSDSHIGKTAIFKLEKSCTLIHGINLLLLRPSKEISSPLLNYQFNYLRQKGSFAAVAQKAVNQSSINQAKLKQFDFFVPPLAEQHRIVAEIEKLFSSLDKAIESINTAKEQLKVYRQAVLKWAFEGRFTNDNIKDGELPEGWKKSNLGEVVKKVSIRAYPNEMPNAKFIGMDSIEPNALKPSTLYDFSDFKSSGNLFCINHVLYGRMRPYLNKVYRAEFDGVCSGEFIVLECQNEFSPELLKYILHHRDFVSFANHKTSGDRPRVSFDDVVDYPINLCSPQEQIKIVSEIESRLSVCDKIEEGIENSLLQAEALRQSILKRAFEGKLVPQDPNDEPASKLIERIKAEREQNGGIRVKKEKKTRVMKEHKME